MSTNTKENILFAIILLAIGFGIVWMAFGQPFKRNQRKPFKTS